MVLNLGAVTHYHPVAQTEQSLGMIVASREAAEDARRARSRLARAMSLGHWSLSRRRRYQHPLQPNFKFKNSITASMYSTQHCKYVYSAWIHRI